MKELKIDGPCSFCGREENGKWFALCPSSDCPSHDTKPENGSIGGGMKKYLYIELDAGNPVRVEHFAVLKEVKARYVQRACIYGTGHEYHAYKIERKMHLGAMFIV